MRMETGIFDYRRIRHSCVLAAVLSLLLIFASCSGQKEEASPEPTENSGVTLQVSTMYAGNDSNTRNFHEAVAEWENMTGNHVDDISTTADEAYKSKVLLDFQTGAEPDILFYFNGVDSEALVAHNRVVSVDEIRELYPEYAQNMKPSMMKASDYDGKIYCIPVNGYWEALFVNTAICEKAGVEVPDKDTSWSEFMETCSLIRESGFTPIAASLAEVPHYWFEYCIYNHQTPETHANVPRQPSCEEAASWRDGLEDLKTMYEQGFFPTNTLSCSDEAAKKMFFEGRAAFMLEGSWCVSQIEQSAGVLEDYAVTFVPGTGTRLSTDIISGLSTGYYITRKAFDDPEKREAAVSFVQYMTSDEMVSKFAEISATALVNGVNVDPSTVSPFINSALDMADMATGTSEAVQDFVPTECRAPIFENMKSLMTGKTGISDAVAEVIRRVNAKKLN